MHVLATSDPGPDWPLHVGPDGQEDLRRGRVWGLWEDRPQGSGLRCVKPSLACRLPGHRPLSLVLCTLLHPPLTTVLCCALLHPNLLSSRKVLPVLLIIITNMIGISAVYS